ncbi:unnamed protein product [Dracunculus medinensis]|uniref:TPT domain-containing protein n=1 Tax=Dracunculus medinensis TaxID=318479 RepID=A0A0N4UJW6_DRAME|nr:unnamed protein product [Dracunculus medinensis]
MEQHPTALRIGSALSYALCSIFIVFVNKILLTNYRFPSFLCAAIGQMLATVIIIFFASCFHIITLPPFTLVVIRKIFPLPLFYGGNLISGLGGTQKIKQRKVNKNIFIVILLFLIFFIFSLPMFTVLRRFSILMTMIMEYLILGTKASFAVRVSVAMMMLGSVVAALYDLTFDVYGYSLIMFNDLCTAANGVYMKRKLEAKELGKYGLLFHNSLLMIVPSILIAFFADDFQKVRDFVAAGHFTFSVAICFILSCVCGFALNYSTVICTHYNSALTTACVGPIKNLFVTYVGMFSSGDYIFAWNNFLGINISVVGSILYAYVTFRIKTISKQRFVSASAQSSDFEPLVSKEIDQAELNTSN